MADVQFIPTQGQRVRHTNEKKSGTVESVDVEKEQAFVKWDGNANPQRKRSTKFSNLAPETSESLPPWLCNYVKSIRERSGADVQSHQEEDIVSAGFDASQESQAEAERLMSALGLRVGDLHLPLNKWVFETGFLSRAGPSKVHLKYVMC